MVSRRHSIQSEILFELWLQSFQTRLRTITHELRSYPLSYILTAAHCTKRWCIIILPFNIACRWCYEQGFSNSHTFITLVSLQHVVNYQCEVQSGCPCLEWVSIWRLMFLDSPCGFLCLMGTFIEAFLRDAISRANNHKGKNHGHGP